MLCAWKHSKRSVPSPSINGKVSVQRQNVCCAKFIRQTNQTGVCYINLAISIFAQDLLDGGRFGRELKRYLKNPRGHIFEHYLRSPCKAAQKITTLGNNRFASDQRRFDFLNRRGTDGVPLLTAVQQRHNDAGIQQYRLHRPKSRKCFLFDPRSGTPERNFPKPITPRLFRRK
jgi:hypothetical protein